MSDFNGYPNSATFCAALYLGNEPRAHKKVADLYKRGKVLAKDIKNLFSDLSLQRDAWVEGEVDWQMILEELLVPILEDEAIANNKQAPTDLLAVLSQCAIEGNIVKLPCQLERALYSKVAQALKDLGGPWNKKAGGHVFKEDPSGLIDDVIVSGRVKKPEKFGYFPTPRALAESVIRMSDIQPGMTILEPSAGSGNLADIVAELIDKEQIFCCELQDKNVETLEEKGYRVECGDFLSMNLGFYQFDRVVMNPPFERQADITHVMHAWNFVKPGGRLVSIMSASVLFRQDRKSTEFRDFVAQFGGEFEENPEGSFKSSGTGVNTVTLTINKPFDFVVEQKQPEYNFCPICHVGGSSHYATCPEYHKTESEINRLREDPLPTMVAETIRQPAGQLSLFG